MENKGNVEVSETIVEDDTQHDFKEGKTLDVPRQEGDPGCCNVHVTIGDVFVGEAFCDLGAGGNLMSLSTFNRIGGLTLRPCFMNVGLVDGSETKHVGMVRNMMIDINVFQFKIDFIVVQDKGEQECPLILRRSSMATAKASVDLEKKEVIPPSNAHNLAMEFATRGMSS
ncbi:hypothetical protein MTR_3g040820 [Medicago truncatula]|uniref:Uncharacterized protein n=1 Tax=Medicago truncatula TaxID=3880 RepID=A0A072UWS2_MEDTR|nr:hypothetical protein MTR_3g040820 [Medicago truncatula]